MLFSNPPPLSPLSLLQYPSIINLHHLEYSYVKKAGKRKERDKEIKGVNGFR